MDLHLNGRSVLVTGASKGIGAAIATAFAQEGCALHLAARDESRLRTLADTLRESYGVMTAIHPVDLSTSAGIHALAEACGDVDILVNNAGAIGRGSLTEISESEWRRVWDLKVFGYINLTRQIFARMSERHAGVIVNLVGMAAERPDFHYIAGASGNAALNMFTLSLGGDSMRSGVRVLAINPGPIDSEKYRKGLEARAEKFFGDRNRTHDVMKEMPVGRPGTVEEVADVVVFLASPRASYVSGTSIRIDAGLWARPPRA